MGCQTQMWSPNFLFLRGKQEVKNSLPDVGCCAGTGVYGELVSASPTLFDVGYFFLCLIYRSHSAGFRVSFRIILYIAVGSVCPWE